MAEKRKQKEKKMNHETDNGLRGWRFAAKSILGSEEFWNRDLRWVQGDFSLESSPNGFHGIIKMFLDIVGGGEMGENKRKNRNERTKKEAGVNAKMGCGLSRRKKRDGDVGVWI